MYNFDYPKFPSNLMNIDTDSTREGDLKVVHEHEGDEGREPTFMEIIQERFDTLARELTILFNPPGWVSLKVANGKIKFYLTDETGTLLPPSLEGYQLVTSLYHELHGLKQHRPNMKIWKDIGIYKIEYEANRPKHHTTECEFRL